MAPRAVEGLVKYFIWRFLFSFSVGGFEGVILFVFDGGTLGTLGRLGY